METQYDGENAQFFIIGIFHNCLCLYGYPMQFLSSLGSIVVTETSEVEEVEVGDEVVVGEYVEDGEESDIEVEVLLPSPLPAPIDESPWEECQVLASGWYNY